MSEPYTYQDPVFQLTEMPYPDMCHLGDPVWVVGRWYWCDETWANAYGPYDTREEADKDCTEYCREYLGARK